MNLQRKLTLLVATGALALGAGHVVQKRAAERMAAAQPDLTVSSITPVAAGPDRVEIPATAPKVELPPLPVSVVDAPPASETPVLAAASNPVARTVMTLILSLLCTVASALPA